MNDFVTFILQHLRTGIWLAIMAAVLCVLIISVCWLIFKQHYKGERRFPWCKTVIVVLLIGYLTVLIYATLLRFGGAYGYNLHPFMAWREAWNLYSLKNWLNLLLNVAMFIPLGLLLPLLAKPFKKAYWMLAAGRFVSMYSVKTTFHR
ncbi:MAG: hypothetical protein GXX89_03395 [Clostridiales bacterium]|nr:hypothetical protein [Clostridiales bacterium]